MSHFDNTLGSVRCDTSIEHLASLVAPFGIGARAGVDRAHFDLLSGGRAMLQDAVVERELLAMAHAQLEAAHARGELPAFEMLPLR